MVAEPVTLPMTGSSAGVGTESGRGKSRLVILLVVVLATATAMCGWAIYLDLHHLFGRAALVYGVLFAFVPVVPMTAAFVWLDRMRPEPPWLLALALGWGALGAAYIAIELNDWLARQVGDAYAATARSAVFIAPWVEEAAKGAIVFVLVWWRRHDFNAVVAGIVYGGLAGVGFAFTENIVYYAQLFQRVADYKGDTGTALDAVERLFLWRGVAAPFVHPMFTMLTGVGIGLAVRYRHRAVRVLAPVAGFCCAVLLHMAYNAAASFVSGEALTAFYLVLLLPTLLCAVALVLAVRRQTAEVVAARLGDYSAFGWFPPSDVEFLAVPRGRRRARRHVKDLGALERDRMRQFQQTGVELGLLRDRLVRGVADGAQLGRERLLLGRLRELRAEVMLPAGTAQGSPVQSARARGQSSW